MTDQTAAPPAASDTAAPDDGMSSQEQDYFSSRGEKTDGLAPAAPVTPDAPASAVQDPAPGADGEDEFEPDGRPKNKGQWVRHGALHAERERRKAAELSARDSHDKLTRADERMKLINEALTPRGPAPEDIKPDPEQDIFGYVRWQERQLDKLNAQITQTGQHAERTKQQFEQTQAETRLHNAYRNDASRFSQRQPDFLAAYAHLVHSRDAELQAYGEDDPKRRETIILNEERDLALRALQTGASPAERIYNLAKLRGYRVAEAAAAAPAAATQSAASAPAAPGNALGSAPAAAPAPTQPSVSEEIARIKAGQGAALSLSNGGGSPGEQLTPAMLADMPQDEFNALMRRLPKSKQKAAFGY